MKLSEGWPTFDLIHTFARSWQQHYIGSKPHLFSCHFVLLGNLNTCIDSVKAKKVKPRCRFIVWYKVWRPIIRLHILPPGHWTCLFVCHLNSTESIQSCSHFGVLNLSYTLPSLSYQVLISTWVKWSIWGLSVLPKDTTPKQCPNIKRGETWYFSENPVPSGIRNRTADSDIGKAPFCYKQKRRI